MQRVLILGSCGAGKSTFARRLHEHTKLNLIHLDQQYWKPGWTEPEKEDWKEIAGKLVEQNSWIIDGNYSNTLPLRLQRADTIIFLDRSRWRCLYRVLKRVMLNFGNTREDMGAGCREHFSLEFLRYVYCWPRNNKPRVLRLVHQYGKDKNLIVLKSDKEVEDLLESGIS